MKDKSNKELIESINKGLKELRKNVKTVFKNIYEEPLSKINYKTSTEFKQENPTNFIETINIEPEMEYGRFWIDIEYNNGEISINFEDNLNDSYECDYQLHADCYNLLNEVSNNIRLIQ